MLEACHARPTRRTQSVFCAHVSLRRRGESPQGRAASGAAVARPPTPCIPYTVLENKYCPSAGLAVLVLSRTRVAGGRGRGARRTCCKQMPTGLTPLCTLRPQAWLKRTALVKQKLFKSSLSPHIAFPARCALFVCVGKSMCSPKQAKARLGLSRHASGSTLSCNIANVVVFFAAFSFRRHRSSSSRKPLSLWSEARLPTDTEARFAGLCGRRRRRVAFHPAKREQISC